MAKTNLQAALIQSKLMGKMTREQKKKSKEKLAITSLLGIKT